MSQAIDQEQGHGVQRDKSGFACPTFLSAPAAQCASGGRSDELSYGGTNDVARPTPL